MIQLGPRDQERDDGPLPEPARDWTAHERERPADSILHVAGNHPLRTHARAADVARGCVRPRGVQREQWHRGSDALTT